MWSEGESGEGVEIHVLHSCSSSGLANLQGFFSSAFSGTLSLEPLPEKGILWSGCPSSVFEAVLFW